MRKLVFIFTSLDCFPLYDIFLIATTSEVRTSRAFKKIHKFINLVEEWLWLQCLKAILLGDAKVLTKYTAPKLPWPISLRSEKRFSGSSLKKRSAISGSFRLPARAALGMLGGGGAWAPATSHYLGLRHDSSHWWLICKTVASYGPKPDREKESLALNWKKIEIKSENLST